MNKLLQSIQINQNINEQLVIQQLDKIFSSSFFKTAYQMQKFLQYIVLKTIRGDQQQLKQYAIAVDALGLPQDFDADTNPVIRIMSGRVRKKLKQYYEKYKEDAVIIMIPKGAYKAEFKKNNSTVPPPANQISLFNYSSVPKLALVCFTDKEQQANSNQFVIRLGDYLSKALSHLIYIRLVAFIPYGDKQDYTQSIKTIKKEHNVDFILSLSVQEFEESQREIMYRFFDVDTLEIYRTETFKVGGDSSQRKKVHEDIVREVSASLIDINQGLVQINWSRKMLESNQRIPLHNQALIYYHYHLNRLCQESFKQALLSCNQILEKNKEDIVANSILASCCRHECSNGFGIIKNPVETGLRAAEIAKNLSPYSLEPHFLFGQMLFSHGEWVRAEEEFRLARSINRYCLTSKFAMGFYFCLMGHWKEGMALIDTTITTKTISYPSDYYLINFLNHFQSGRNEEALSSAIKITNPNNFHGPISRCVCYIKLAQFDKAEKEKIELLNRYPDFKEKGQQYLSMLLVNQAYVDNLWDTFSQIQIKYSHNKSVLIGSVSQKAVSH